MSLEVTKQELLKQAIYLKKLYETTRVQDYKDQETRIRKIVVDLDAFIAGGGGGGSQNLQEVTDAGAITTNPISVGGITSPFFQLDTTATPVLQPGMFGWNDTDGTANLRLKGNNVTLQLGQETLVRVVNKTGADLLESQYKAVRIRLASEGGAAGQRLAVVLAKGDADLDSVTTLGIVTETIPNNQEGFVTVFGNVNEINTTGSLQGETWLDGDVLYLSPTTAGSLTKVKPTAPNHTVTMGYVIYAHAVHGKIFVKVDNGYELEELHDVLPTPYVNKGVLYRDTATNLWKSATIETLLGGTPLLAVPTLAQVTTAGNTTTNAITVGGLTVATNLIVTDAVNGRINFGDTTTSDSSVVFRFTKNTTSNVRLGVYGSNKVGVYLGLVDNYAAIYAYNYTAGAAVPLILNGFGGNVLINTTTDAGYKLDVNGTARVQNQLTTTGSITASSAIARGVYFNQTLTAAANNDVLVGLDINPTFTVGSFTGVTQYALRINSGAVLFNNTTGVSINGGGAVYPNIFRDSSDGGFLIRSFDGTTYTANLKVKPNGNVIIQNGGTFTDAGYRLDVNGTTRLNGLQTFQGTTASDSASLGSELTTTGTGTNWTGTEFATGYTHTTGSTADLTSALAATNGAYYQISYTITGRTTGSITITFGGVATGGIISTSAKGIRAISTGTLAITPTTDFNGTVVLSIKAISNSSAITTWTNSSGTTAVEFRTINTAANNSIFIGQNGGFKVTTGIANIGIGYQAGSTITTGSWNIAIGVTALQNITSGGACVAIGLSALQANLSSNNTAVGFQAGYTNVSGTGLTAIGFQALYNSTGNNNTAVGFQSLVGNSTGTNNTAVGMYSNTTNTTGEGNTAIGYGSINLNSTGIQNTAVGKFSLYNNTASYNTAFGASAGQANTSGTGLTAVGYQALIASTGNNNTAVGYQAGLGVTSGTGNILIGYQTATALTTGTVNTFIGNSITALNSGDANVAIGNLLNATGSSNTIIGYASSSGNFTATVVLGRGATATANNQFVVGSSSYNAGTITPAVAPVINEYWTVVINGVAKKIALIA